MASAAGIFNAREVERLKNEHLTGARKHSKLLFSLLDVPAVAQRSTGRAAPGRVPVVTFAA